ncbi:hypothetical protein GQ43DRAFT_298999 [Delitschia confertaspora ATCC 74209]|uniref:Uncharacterized protein n=1 Tax=Delitschia confertaspora ATCC 74209 TaxID=1513339 RepID=A0A9P4N0D7_9PLEO|nr:hypothetical protein GQ43DRAFT_298999 [Delitschia confertaspora ATCC 74209]
MMIMTIRERVMKPTAPENTLAGSSAPKRPRDDSSALSLPRRTRIKFSPPETNSTSEVSQPENSSVFSTSRPSESAAASDVDSDSESELSESSSDPSSASSTDEESSSDEEEDEVQQEEAKEEGSSEEEDNVIIDIIPRPAEKPKMRLSEIGNNVSDLKARLQSFLPQLKAANEELERERRAGTLKNRVIEGDEGGGEYIEMDLGLGVLEHKGHNGEDKESEDESEDDEDNADENKERSNEKDILGKLMGQNRRKAPAAIQEVGDT